MIIPMLCVTIFVILVVWFLLPRVARLMIHTPTAISIFVCLSMVQLMAVFSSMRCTLCGHFLQVALTLSLVVGYFFFSSRRRHTRSLRDWSSDVCSSDLIGWIVGMALSSAVRASGLAPADRALGSVRSEERRVGKECRSRGWPNQEQLKTVFITMQCTFCEQLLQIQVARILAVVYDIGDS